jgi:hypothetical protein
MSAKLGRGGAVKEKRQMARSLLSFDAAYLRWRAEFAPFESNCFDALCEFVRTHFDNLIEPLLP